jgi:hypothetical protein
MTKPPLIKVECREVQRLCRECNCLEWLLTLRTELTVNKPASVHSGQVPGTLSQIVRCYDADNALVLVVHQFLRPDGTIGASGKPDPKRILRQNTVYYC